MINMEEMVLRNIIEWKNRKGVSFTNDNDLIEAYWEEYFDGQRPVRNENFECIG